jgi:hypothetical protein
VLRIAASAVVVEAAVRMLSLATVSRLAGVRLDDTPGGEGDGWDLLTPDERARGALALRVLAARPFQATCLRRSLVLGQLLRHRHPVLRVGVAKNAGVVAAHAWIEIDGRSLDATSGDYRVLPHVAGRRATRATQAVGVPTGVSA